jgi:hypothetical protein
MLRGEEIARMMQILVKIGADLVAKSSPLCVLVARAARPKRPTAGAPVAMRSSLQHGHHAASVQTSQPRAGVPLGALQKKRQQRHRLPLLRKKRDGVRRALQKRKRRRHHQLLLRKKRDGV